MAEARERQLQKRDRERARLIDAAEQWYLEGRPIDITTLAAEHGVSRASGYRWLGDNDLLLAEILTIRLHREFAELEKKHRRKTGAERLLGILRDFVRDVTGSRHVQPLLERDPSRVMRVLMSPAYDTQRHFIDIVERLIQEEVNRDTIVLAVDVRSLAFAIVRLCEAFLYADFVAGETRDPDTAIEIIGLVFAAQAPMAVAATR